MFVPVRTREGFPPYPPAGRAHSAGRTASAGSDSFHFVFFLVQNLVPNLTGQKNSFLVNVGVYWLPESVFLKKKTIDLGIHFGTKYDQKAKTVIL